MSSLEASLSRFQADRAEAAARNLPAARSAPTPARTGTPKPAAAEKRSHDNAFSGGAGGNSEIFKVVVNTIEYLKGKNAAPVPFDEIIRYLSLPVYLQGKQETIKRALRGHNRVDYLPASSSPTGKESFKYKPLHPVTNGDELLEYLHTLDNAQGIPVKELKDGWPDCVPTLQQLEAQGHVLLLNNKKDGVPKAVYRDDPSYYTIDTKTGLTAKVDPDFVKYWGDIKLPANENDIRSELLKAQLTPTSAVKETSKVEVRKKERKRAEKKNAKKTNIHIMGMLKDPALLRKQGGR